MSRGQTQSEQRAHLVLVPSDELSQESEETRSPAGPLDASLHPEVFEELQRRRRLDGTYANEDLEWAAEAFGRDPRTVQRYLKSGKLPDREGQRVTFCGDSEESRRLREEFVLCLAKVPELHRRLTKAEDLSLFGLQEVPCRRTLDNWVRKDFSKRELVALRKGARQAKDFILRARLNGGHPDTHTGEPALIEVDVDSKDLHVRAHRPGGGDPVPVVVTLAVVRRSSFIAGIHVSPKEDGEATAYCIADMLARFGQPDIVQLDNHGAKNADQVGETLSQLDHARQRNSKVLTPEHNGGVEAANGALAKRLASRIGPSFDLPTDARGKPVVDPNEYGMPFEVIVKLVYEAAAQHNNESEIERLGYVTPAEAEPKYPRQPTPVPMELLVKLLPSKEVKVVDEGVKLDIKAAHAAPAPFVCAELAPLVGKKVRVHYAGARPRSVWVVHDGEVIGEAFHVDTLTEEQRGEITRANARIAGRIEADKEFLIEHLKSVSIEHATAGTDSQPAQSPTVEETADDRSFAPLKEAS